MSDLEALSGFNEKCAVAGVVGNSRASALVEVALQHLQHRGQDGSGIAAHDGRNIYRHADLGRVEDVYKSPNFLQLSGKIAIGHNRYGTSGNNSNKNLLQPIMSRYGRPSAFVHNGNLPETDLLNEFLSLKDVRIDGLNDSALMAAAIDVRRRDINKDLVDSVEENYELFTGAFSCIAMDGIKLVAFRDGYGIRPLSYGFLPHEIGGGIAVASETCALEALNAGHIEDILPGEIISFSRSGEIISHAQDGSSHMDALEFVYFADPASNLQGVNVGRARYSMGRNLALEQQVDNADMVVAVPNSAIPIAGGYSQESNIELSQAITKNPDIHRTFIAASDEERRQLLREKFIIDGKSIKDNSVVLVDDSLVRGTTMQELVGLLRAEGVGQIHLRIGSPPVRYPDFYGINLPNQTELLAYGRTVEQMGEELGVDSLAFLSMDGLVGAIGLPKSQLATQCFDGEYPLPIGEEHQSKIDFSSGSVRA